MKILYCAIDQVVPGTLGGSTHVQAVAEGLAARGHDVHVLVAPGVDAGDAAPSGPTYHAMGAPLGRPHLRLLRAPAVARLARWLRPDVVIERYHNFGGEGVRAATTVGALAVLEVNAPLVDYPGSPKARLDRALVVRPLARWRRWQSVRVDLFVTPTAAILPPDVPASKVLEIEWGADTGRFHPGATGPLPFARRPGHVLAIFAGAFRPWHGARMLVDAVGVLHARGRNEFGAVFVGDGPERTAVMHAARGLTDVAFTGTIAHARMPAALAAADIGVAPFDVARHPPLRTAFYWSPLKIFEYMASGLPVVAPALPRLSSLVADGLEGALYHEPTAEALAHALESLADPARRRAAGAAARARAERDYSWAAHCARLDQAIHVALANRAGPR